MLVECLLIADDLTGACDAAVQFSAQGFIASVSLDMADGATKPDVLAVSTESRGLSREEAGHAIANRARRLAEYEPRILFKKIDSTLRGNAGAEIAATLLAFGCEAAVITPAFPAMKRIVVDGWLRLDGQAEFEPVELAGYLRAHGLDSHRYISADAVCDADLDAIVEAGMESKSRILWAGSAGLAAALARRIRGGSEARRERRTRYPTKVGPVLFCIGSTHSATLAQQRLLLAERPICELSAESATPGELAKALRNGCNAMLTIPRGRIADERIAELLSGTREAAAALTLSGGDTASQVCRALHAHSIELHDEVEAGIPWGTLHGGALSGIAVVTKSGGFGDSGALIAITDFFTCQKV